MMEAVCISSSIAHARRTMETDWGWRRAGMHGDLPIFYDPEGTIVHCVSDCTRLCGRTPRKIYLGYDFHKARDYENWNHWYQEKVKT